MLGEGEAGKLLAKILHHVVALELAMHEHIEPDILLPAHGACGLVLQESPVGAVAQSSTRMRSARIPDVGRLRKRADGRGGEGRQLEACVLDFGALRKGAAAFSERWCHCCHSLRHGRIASFWRSPTRGC